MMKARWKKYPWRNKLLCLENKDRLQNWQSNIRKSGRKNKYFDKRPYGKANRTSVRDFICETILPNFTFC